MWDWQYTALVGVLLTTVLATKLVVEIYRRSGRDPADLRVTSGKYTFAVFSTVIILYIIETGLVYFAQVYFHGHPFTSLGFDSEIFRGLIAGTCGGTLVFSLPKLIAFVMAQERQFRSAFPRDETSLHVAGIFSLLLFGLLTNSFIEELVFRAYPIEQLSVKSLNAGLVILISALLFSLIHHVIEPFSLQAFLRRFLIGVVYGELYVLSNSIWLLIGVHTGSNIAALMYSGKWRIGGIFHIVHDRPELEITLGYVLGVSVILGLGLLAYL
jgi:membrane protease YdiL (CAAX protease family)